MIAYNALRGVMAEVADEHDIEATRLSFTGTLERLREGLRDAVLDLLPSHQERRQKMKLAILRSVVPKRPGRRFPRAVKVKMSGFPLKRNAA